MKALVAGIGSIGVRHLNNLYALGVEQLSAFRSRNLPPPADIACKNIEVFQDYDRALSSGPDIAVIANPTSYHLAFAEKALSAGCHVYIEKPVSHSLDGTDRLLALARNSKKVVMVGCQHRFLQTLAAVRAWIQNGDLGNILSVTVDMGEYLPGWHPWEDYRQSYAARSEMGGGVILTLIHELDYLYWIFGPVETVYAMGGHLTPLETDAEDTALISLMTAKGVPVQLRMDYWRNPPVKKMNIVGEKGEIDWDYYGGEARLCDKGSVHKRATLPENWERNDLFLSIMRNFLEAIEKNEAPLVPLEESVDVLKIALAAKESISRNEVIRL